MIPEHGAPIVNDSKNSPCWSEGMDEMALYVHGKVSLRYAVLGLGYGDRALCKRRSLQLIANLRMFSAF
jgi:hypothetical protein